MNRLSLIIVTALFLFASPALAQSEGDTTSSDQPFDAHQWMQFYYQTPDPSKTFDAIKSFYQDKSLTDPEQESVVIGFLAILFRAQPEITETVRDSIVHWEQNARRTIINGLWFANTKQSRGEIKKLAKSDKFLKPWTDKRAPDIYESEAFYKSTLDMMWGFFYATGDTKYVDKILSSFNSEEVNNDSGLVESVRESLYEHCLDHRVVYDWCHGMAGKYSDRIEKEIAWIEKRLRN